MAKELFDKCNNTAGGAVVSTTQMDERKRQTERTKRSKATKHLFEAVIVPYLQGMGYTPPPDFRTKVGRVRMRVRWQALTERGREQALTLFQMQGG